jgi:hypothetical protein
MGRKTLSDDIARLKEKLRQRLASTEKVEPLVGGRALRKALKRAQRKHRRLEIRRKAAAKPASPKTEGSAG